MEGIPLLREALSTREARGLRVWNSLIATRLGEGLVAAGHLDEARAAAEKALALARNMSERGHEAYALRLQGEIAAHGDPLEVETAAVHYDEALTLASELGMRPLVAHCYDGLGTLHRRAGQLEPARKHLSAATELYREMGMGFWLKRIEPSATD